MMSGIAKNGPAKHKHRFLGRVAFLLIMPALLCGSDQQTQIEYQQSRRFNAILIVARVNDKPAVLIVDTGSDRTIISPHLLISEPVSGNLRVSFLAAHRNAPAAWGRATLQLSNRTWKELLVVVQDQSELRQAFGQSIDGILGQDILGQFRRVIIDSEHHLLTLQQ
jgi:hypothetical protein